MAGMQFAMRPLNFVISVILARVLAPSDFGLVTLALVLVQSSNLFSGLGMGQVIIHSKADRGKLAYQAFVVAMSLGLLLFALVQLFSGTLTMWLGDVRTQPLLRWLSGLILLNALSLIPLSLLRKDLKFEKVALASLFSQIVYAVVVIGLALTGFGVWSMVYANLIFTAVTTVLYWIWSPSWDWVKPKPWDGALMKQMLGYGVQASGSGFLAYFHTHFDDWLVGRTLGVTALGFYSKSYDFSNSTVGQLARSTIGMVFFPSYSKIQDDKTRLARAYLKTVRLVFLFITPLALGTFAVAAPLVQVIFGDKWMPMVTVLQIFALLILTRPISENIAPILQAVGLPGYNIRAGLVLIGVMLPLLWLAMGPLQWGIEGAALAIGLSHLVGALYNVYQANLIMPGTAKATGKVAGPILVAGLLMMASIYLVKGSVADYYGTLDTIPALLTLIAVGALTYLILVAVTQRDLILEIWRTLLSALPVKMFGHKPARLSRKNT